MKEKKEKTRSVNMTDEEYVLFCKAKEEKAEAERKKKEAAFAKEFVEKIDSYRSWRNDPYICTLVSEISRDLTCGYVYSIDIPAGSNVSVSRSYNDGRLLIQAVNATVEIDIADSALYFME